LTTLHLNGGMYYSGVGNWSQAHVSYQKAQERAKSVKDWHWMEDTASFALKNIIKASPTMFFNFIGYTAVVEMFLLLLQWLYAAQGMGSRASHVYLEKIKEWGWEKPASVSCQLDFCHFCTVNFLPWI